MTSGTAGTPRRILLSGVFGPFGVDDDWGRRENIMELFHNQVTKAQGAASFRFHHRSFGLYFLAENVDADVTVLDFPSRERFVRELRKGYDLVGISFIAPNFAKAREMARLVRLHAPGARIVLGGHGAAIEGVEELVDCDHVVRGEGIRRPAGAPRPGPGRADRPPGPAEHRAPEHPRHPAPGALREPPRPRRRLRERLPLLQHLALLRQGLPAVPRHRPRALRDGPPDRRPDRDRRLLRHGRELPEGHRPRPRAPRRDGAAPALLRLPDLLLGGGDPGVRPRQHGPSRRQLRLDRRRVGDPDRQLRQERGRRRPPARPGSCATAASPSSPRASSARSTTRRRTSAPRSTSWSGSRRTWRSSCCSRRCRSRLSTAT